MHADPYQAPLARIDDTPGLDEAADRRLHLRREAAIRTLGGAWLLFSLGIVALGGIALATELARPPEARFGLVFALVLTGLGGYGVVAAWGLAMLRPAARFTAAVAFVLTLPMMVSVLFTGLCAYLVYSARGRRVLADDYAGVRARTPHLRARSRPGEALVVLGVLALHVVALVALSWWQPR
jgi:hypothetical protein